MGNHYAFGDSLMNPTGQPVVGYVSMLNAQLGVTFDNRAHSGDGINDQLKQVYTVNSGVGDVSLLAAGINDLRQYSKNNVSGGRDFYRGGRQAAIGWLALLNKQTARDPNCIKAGSSFVNAQTFNVGLRASTIGDNCTFHIQGNVGYVAVQIAEPAGQNGKYTLSTDGGTPVEFDGSAPGLTSVNGFPYSDRLHRFVFGGSITDWHTIQWKLTTATYGYPEWAAGNYQPSFPTVGVGNITRMSSVTGVANFGYASWGGSDAITSAWNGDTTTDIANWVADGADVRLIDLTAAVSPLTDLSGSDGLHWAQSGHLSVFGAASAVMGSPSLSSIPVYRRSDGLYFIGDGSDRVRVLTSP